MLRLPIPTLALLALTLVPVPTRADEVGAEFVELFRRADPVPGSTAGALAEVRTVYALGNDSWAMQCVTGQGANYTVVDGVVTSIPAYYWRNGHVSFNASAQAAWSVYSSELELSQLYRDGVLIAQEGQPLLAAGVSADSTYTHFEEVRIDGAGNVVAEVRFNDPQVQGTQYGLVRLTLDVAGNIIDEELIIRVGDRLEDGAEVLAVVFASWPYSTSLAISDAGDVLTSVLVDEGGTLRTRVLWNGGTWIQHGARGPGGTWGLDLPLLTFSGSGEPAMVGRLSPSQKVAFVGESALLSTNDAHPVETSTGLHYGLGVLRFDADDNMLWYGSTEDGRGAVFLNGLPLVEEGVTRINGDLVVESWADYAADEGQDTYAISTDGQTIYMRLTVENPDPGGVPTEQVVVRLDIGPWQNLGEGLVGTDGLRPTLWAQGPLTPGSTAKMRLANTLPNATTYLVLGVSRLDAPFKGGVLVPSVDVLVPGLPVDADGRLAFDIAWPAGLPAGAQLYWQFWTQDPGGVFGFSSTNALVSTAP